MSKRKALMMTGSFPCIRVGKITEALQNYGWQHDVLCAQRPPQMDDVYNRILDFKGVPQKKLSEAIADFDGELIHVNNEPNWTVKVAKEAAGDRPVILNVHDVTSARPRQEFDPFEEQAYAYADAFIWVTDEQREFATRIFGKHIEGKPYAVIGNYTTSRYFIDGTPLQHLGGVVYEGGLDDRNTPDRWRSQHEIADAFEHKGTHFHIYSDNPVSYGTQHEREVHFPILVQRLAQHDWGWCGIVEPNQAWGHAIPNKFFDYLAAGIPVLAMNCPAVKPFCEAGLGIYVESVEEALEAYKKANQKAYRKVVLANRSQYTMLSHIGPVVNLYEELTK